MFTGGSTGLFCMSIRESVNELQQTQMKEMERACEQLQDELRRKEAEYEEKLAQIRQQQTSKVRWVSVGVGPGGGVNVQKALKAQ